jgi:pSer/pThr/pTyr-binding forkhead associated (FHA) protein
MPFESHAAKIIRIGRSPDSEVVLDFPIVSWNHAQLRVNGDLILEDVGSLNGTAVNQVENKISRCIVRPEDEIYFGSVKVPVSRLLVDRAAMGGAAFQQVAVKEEVLLLGRDPGCS